ncbi:hypothetical protein PCANB_000694 [Pneumocystis canis]|nr:hypothetical protein PCANB_000694 [Pneumocystis canis]
MNYLETFSYTSISRIRVFIYEEEQGICELLKRLNPVRLIDLINYHSKGIFSPETFPEGQIIYDFVTRLDLRHSFLHTFEIYRKTWAILWIFNGSKPGFEKKIEKTFQYFKINYPKTLIIRFFILNAPNTSFNFSSQVITLPTYAISQEDIWRPILHRLTLDLLEEFSIFAQEIQLKTWIESPYENFQIKNHLNINSSEQVLELDINIIEKKKIQLKGRKTKIIADLYLLSGHVMDGLKEYTEAVLLTKSSNDYLWQGSALEGIGVCLVILSFLQIEYQIPTIVLPSSPPPLEKIGLSKNSFPKEMDQDTSKQHIFDFLPDLHLNIIDLYQKSYNSLNDRIPPLCFSESILRLSRLFCLVHLAGGWNNVSLRGIVYDQFFFVPKSYTSGYPPKAEIVSWAMRAHTPYIDELDVADKCRIYGGLASILGMVGFRRARAMFLREIISALTPALMNVKIDGITDDTICSIVQIALTNYSASREYLNIQNSSLLTQNLLDDLCDSYGILGMSEKSTNRLEVEMLGKYGWPSLKIIVLKECISFCEALPDFSGVLSFTTKMLTIASTYLSRDNQIRLASNIPRIILAVRRLGLDELKADYWDSNIIQSIEYIPCSSKFLPVLHSSLELNTVSKDNKFTSSDPFIYNPFTKKSNTPIKHVLVEGDVAEFKVILHNPLAFELECVDISLFTEGAEFESQSTSLVIGPQRIHMVRLFGCPKEPGSFVVKGCRIHLSGCKDDLFLVNRDLSSVDYERLFSNVFYEGKTKLMGLDMYSIIKTSIMSNRTETYNKDVLFSVPMTIEENFEVLPAQPILIVTRTSLVNGSIMLLEGERQALVWKKKKDKFFLGPDSEEILEIEVLGKRGFTDGKIQIDYGNIQGEVSSLEQFYTRRVVVPIIVTVNGSVELVNCDIINYVNDNKERENAFDGSEEMISLFQYAEAHEREGVEYCLGLLDFRNIWPKPLCVYFNVQNEDDEPFKIEKLIYPGETNRLVLPLKRIYISREDSQKPILTFSTRQFIVSTDTNMNSDVQNYQQRRAFWLREALFKIISGTWSQPETDRKGFIELRGLRMTSKMVYCLKVEDISVILEVSGTVKKIQRFIWLVKLYEFVTFTLKVINRKGYPIKTLARIQPCLRYQNKTYADLSRCVVFNGVTQTVLPRIESHHFHEEKYTAVFMSKGEYEIIASIQELSGPDKGRVYASRSYPVVKYGIQLEKSAHERIDDKKPMERKKLNNDVTTWSPQGRLYQVEYAMEAVKQGSVAIGIVSKTHAVLCALKRNPEDLGSYQKKIIKIDDHMGLALAGLTSDARMLSNFMRQQAIASKMVCNRRIPICRAVSSIANKAQINTQQYGRRPYGVGFLVVGCDDTGPHLYEFLPSGSVLEYTGASIGARSQPARTYLERASESFPDATLDELVLHGLKALRDSLAQDKELTPLNTSIGIVGKDMPFKLIENGETVEWLSKLGKTSLSAYRESERVSADSSTTLPAEDIMETD